VIPILGGCVVVIGVALMIIGRFGRKPGHACGACGARLQNRGFVSWNGTADGVGFVTTGVAAPSERFAARLRSAAATPPPGAQGGLIRIVGALTLFECDACSAKFVDEQGVGLRACDPEQWRDLVSAG